MSIKRYEWVGMAAKEFRFDPEVGQKSAHNVVLHAWQNTDGYYLNVTLHGNHIAACDRIGEHITIRLRDCGWPTQTTRNVLNALLYGLGASERLARKGSEVLIDGDVPLEAEQWTIIVTNV